MPQANSTFSRPRATSPRASDSTLPCSAVTSDAISLRLASTSSRRRNITSARRDRPVARHSGRAALAAATAASTSAAVGEVDLGGLLAGGGVVDGAGAARRAGDGAAVDPVLDGPHVRHLLGTGAQIRYCDRPRFTNRPWPLRPLNVSSSTTTVPRDKTVSTLPSIT